MHIGRIAKKVGLTPDAIRFYEPNGLLPRPPRTEGGFRQYGESDVETLVRAPISLVVDLSSSNTSLANAHAHTCVTQPAGRAFLTLPLPTEVFKPGQILETVLLFTGTEGEDIDFTTKVLATPGER